jgi:hypothetical protein
LATDFDIDEYDPHPKRRFVKCNTKTAQGYALEDIPTDTLGEAQGIALINRAWHPDIYLMNFHEGWTVEDYYELAKKLIKEKHIEQANKLDGSVQ